METSIKFSEPYSFSKAIDNIKLGLSVTILDRPKEKVYKIPSKLDEDDNTVKVLTHYGVCVNSGFDGKWVITDKTISLDKTPIPSEYIGKRLPSREFSWGEQFPYFGADVIVREFNGIITLFEPSQQDMFSKEWVTILK